MKTIWRAWIIRVVLLAAVAGIAVYLHGATKAVRLALYAQQQEVLKGPEELLYAGTLRSTLAKHEFDIERIDEYVLYRDNVASAVEEIEAMGSRVGVDAIVSNIAEVPSVDESGQPAPPSAPVTRITLHIAATGSPENLLRFAYLVEHMPYLAYLDEWTLAAGQDIARGASSAQPQQIRGEGEGAQVESEAILELDVIMYVHYDE